MEVVQCLNSSRPFQRVGLPRIKVTPSQHHQKKMQKLNQRQKLAQRREALPIHRPAPNPHCSQQSPAWQDDPRCRRNHALPLALRMLRSLPLAPVPQKLPCFPLR
ncbi:leucine-rich repeat-containing protein 16A-like [Columba livia]|uniref:Leucine-rich repeat-containing protein 16A-like n=1 Tax=Columba livia TaxID=8932 RepID=A0A2I0MWN9_COLLI|nr:leucine-rich repeat-containing protein 16A-like [Columba livia]